jgi:hypothetical protein
MKAIHVIVGVVLVAVVAGAVVLFNGDTPVDKPLEGASGTDHLNVENFQAGILFRDNVASSSADRTLGAIESGSTFIVGTAGLDFTLPSPSKGLYYKFIVGSNFATTNMTVQGPISGAGDDVIFGALEVAGAVVACSAEDLISFVNTAELPGDYVEITSDGTNWYITGQGTTAGSITCTDAD